MRGRKVTLANNADFQIINLTLGPRSLTTTIPVSPISSPYPPPQEKTWGATLDLHPSLCLSHRITVRGGEWENPE